jgi:hypothetical protein
MLIGDLAANVLAGVYDPSGGVQLQVAADDAERAETLLAELRSELAAATAREDTPLTAAGRPGWLCKECKAVVDLEMEVCPSCGRAMDLPADSESPITKALARRENIDPETEKEVFQTWVGDKLADRALKAALIGLVFCPPLLHLYSISVLIQLRHSGSQLSEPGRSKAWLAWVVNVIVFGIATVMILYFFFSRALPG